MQTADTCQILNLSSQYTMHALKSAALCETVKIKIENLTPSSGPVNIPIRYIDNPSASMAVETLEEIVGFGLATKTEFRTLKKIYDILNSNF